MAVVNSLAGAVGQNPGVRVHTHSSGDHYEYDLRRVADPETGELTNTVELVERRLNGEEIEPELTEAVEEAVREHGLQLPGDEANQDRDEDDDEEPEADGDDEA